MALLWCLVLAVVIPYVTADYDCLCNSNEELGVHSEMTDSSPTVGSLYKYNCKELLTTLTVDSGWAAIAYEHNIRYVKTDANTKMQMCPGDSPASDKVSNNTTVTTTTMASSPVTYAPSTSTTEAITQPTTTTTRPSPTSSTTNPTTTTTVTTTQPTTTTPSTTTTSTTIPPTTATVQAEILSGHTNLCLVALRSFTSQDRGVLAQYDKSCYELVPHATSWIAAENDCKSKGAHLVQINTQGEQDCIYDLIRRNHNQNTWIGLHNMNHETFYEWTSGETVVYTNWLYGQPPHHSTQDCVYLNPHDGGHWVDGDCGSSGGFLFGSSINTRPYICQYEVDTSVQANGTVIHHGDGDTHMCPSTVLQHASEYHGILGQYGQSCYELLPSYDVSWQHGEQLCRQEGGHLAHITNADEQSFVQEFTTNHMPTHGAWIGLNDRASEGDAVVYTNWAKGHTGNWDSPGREDCALFLPYANGHWDDLPCGSSSGFFGDTGESHPIICQFGLSHGSSAVG